jgi:multiple sugar transport system permease protein
MNNLRFKGKIFVLCIPGFAGFIWFFLLPFGKSLWYSFIDDVYHKNFVWFDNYITVLKNQYFRLALKNTLVFSIIGVVLLLLISFALSVGLSKLKKQFNLIKSAFILPMLLPSVSIIFVWNMVFDNDIYFSWMRDGGSFLQVLPIYALYLWKNTGINVILLTAALTQISREILEAAELDGVRGIKLYRFITIPLIAPSLFFVGILSFVNSLKIFKESYLFYNTNYPPDAAYTIQYYMNNHFTRLNYQNLSCASAIVAIILAIMIYVVYRVQNRYMRDVSL